MDAREKMAVPGEFGVLRYEAPEFRGEWREADYGDPLDERCQALLAEFGIASVVAGHDTEFDAILALKRWVRCRWDHGWSLDFRTVTDGLSILRAAAEGARFCCGHYARVFVDCATALGWPARLVGISIADCEFPRGPNVGNVGHAVAEIWSNEHGKWVMMDPDLNCHYTSGDMPLNALEIRSAWLDRESEAVDRIIDEPGFVLPTGGTLELAKELTPGLNDFTEDTVRRTFARFNRHRAIDYYARVRIGGRELTDDRLLPTFVSHFAPSPHVRFTSNVDDLYPTVNAVRLSVAPTWDAGGASVGIGLEHCMPFFSHYETRIDGGSWARSAGSFDWPVREGVNRLDCRGVNAVGRPGIASRIDVAYARARW